MLSRIHVFRAHDYAEQLAFVRCLPDLIRALAPTVAVRLVVVDSVAFHFRHDFSDLSARARALTRLAQQLNAVAAEFRVAVLVTNHMTTRVDGATNADASAPSELVPALGESWSHAVANRVLVTPTDAHAVWSSKLRPNESVRVRVRGARLVKSASMPPRRVEFLVTPAGIRGVPAVVVAAHHQAPHPDAGDVAKRHRSVNANDVDVEHENRRAPHPTPAFSSAGVSAVSGSLAAP